MLADVLQHLISPGQLGPEPMPSLRTRADLKDALLHFARELGSRLMQRDYLELARLVIAETPRLPQLGDVFRRSVPERSLRRAVDLLHAAQKAGLIGDTDIAAAARMLVGPVVIQVLQQGLLSAPTASHWPAPALDTDSHIDLFLAMLPAISREER